MMVWKIKKAIKVAKNYIKHPYHFLDGGDFSEGCHDHVCFPYRLMYDDFRKVCPHYMNKDIEPEHSDCCDNCKYFGIVDYYTDEDGKENVMFCMNKDAATVFVHK